MLVMYHRKLEIKKKSQNYNQYHSLDLSEKGILQQLLVLSLFLKTKY